MRFYNWGLFLQLCVIAECGELKKGDDWGIFPKDGSGDSHPDFPEDADVDLKDVSNLRFWSFLVAQMVKNLPAVQQTGVGYLRWEDPLEEGMAIHSSILAWRIPWTEELGWLQSPQRVRHDWATNKRFQTGQTAKENLVVKFLKFYLFIGHAMWHVASWLSDQEWNHTLCSGSRVWTTTREFPGLKFWAFFVSLS